MANTKIRLGIIGAGKAFEQLHLPALNELKDKYEIAALCDVDIITAKRVASSAGIDLNCVYTDYNELMSRNDIDALDILTPIETNHEVSKAAVSAGYSFICEKPLAHDRESAETMLAIMNNYDGKILIAENYRYSDEFNIIKQILNDEKIGIPAYFIYNKALDFEGKMLGNTFEASEWRQHPSYRGGTMLDAAVHDIAAIRHIFGKMDKVQAFGRPQSKDYSPYFSICATMQFSSSLVGQFSFFPGGFEAQKPPVGFRIFGTKGSIYLESSECGTVNIFYNDGNSEQISYTPNRGYYNELLNFYNAMKESEEIKVTPRVEYGDAKCIFDILDSIENDQPAYVDERPRKSVSYENNNYQEVQGNIQ